MELWNQCDKSLTLDLNVSHNTNSCPIFPLATRQSKAVFTNSDTSNTLILRNAILFDNLTE